MKHEQNVNSLNDRVRLIRIQTFLKNTSGNPAALVAGGALLVLVLYRAEVAANWLMVWFAVLVLTSGVLAFFERFVKRTGISPGNAERVLRLRILLGGMNCAQFGLIVFFLPDQMSGTAHIFAFFVASTVVTVSYMTNATVFSYCLLANALALLPFTVFYFRRYLIAGDSFYLLMGVAAIVWQFVVAGKALQVSRSAIGVIVASERLRDEMTDRVLAEQALRASKEQSQHLASMLRLMCDNVPDMIWAKDLENRYIFANLALCEKLLNAASTEEPLGKTFDYFVQRERERHPDDPQWHTFGQFSQDVDRHTIGRDEATTFEESGNVCGRFVFLDVHQARFIDAKGEVIGTVGCARDITERKASEVFVQHLAHHDVLTDLANRALLTDRLRQALAQAQRDKLKLAVLFIDLDRLKPVNDTLGHDVGDLLLMQVANRLRIAVTRATDTVSRFGGDEFVILLQRINKEQDAAAVAEKVLTALSQPFSIDQHPISISASIGIAVFPQHGGEADVLLRNADSAMYGAKRGGRNGYRFFAESTACAVGDSGLAE